MQMFLHSSTHSSPRGYNRFRERGFTLVELLISIAIIVIVTSIVLVKYSKFDSTTLLKGAAHEIAISLREAQIKSLSVTRAGNSFDYPYGISFTPSRNGVSTGKSYYVFRYEDDPADGYDAIPSYDVGEASPKARPVSTTTLDRSMYIKDVCIVTTDPNDPDCDVGRVDISFRRPEFNALMYAEDESGAVLPGFLTRALIKVGSANGSGEFTVEVTHLGQISVYTSP